MKAWLGVGFVVAGCSVEVGPSAAWQDVSARTGAFTAEVQAPPQLAGPASQVRIVTFNVEKGADVEGLVAAFTTSANLQAADIVLVQEIEAHPDEPASRARRLADGLGMGYAYAPERLVGEGSHGPAILSRWPLERVEIMELPFAELAFSSAPRLALGADVRIGTHLVRVVDLHLDTRLNVGERIQQLRPAVIDAAWPTVVGGDFNTNPYAWAGDSVPDVPASTVVDTDQAPALDDYMRHLAFDTPTAELGPTQSVGGVLESRLDAIYTRGLAVTPGAVERMITLSDHWPMFIDLTLE